MAELNSPLPWRLNQLDFSGVSKLQWNHLPCPKMPFLVSAHIENGLHESSVSVKGLQNPFFQRWLPTTLF